LSLVSEASALWSHGYVDTLERERARESGRARERARSRERERARERASERARERESVILIIASSVELLSLVQLNLLGSACTDLTQFNSLN